MDGVGIFKKGIHGLVSIIVVCLAWLGYSKNVLGRHVSDLQPSDGVFAM